MATASPTFKIVTFINQGVVGWSETWYFVDASPSGAGAQGDAIAAAAYYANARLAAMPSLAPGGGSKLVAPVIYATRVENISSFGDLGRGKGKTFIWSGGQVKEANGLSSVYSGIGELANQAGSPWNAVYIAFTVAGSDKRKFLMRGISNIYAQSTGGPEAGIPAGLKDAISSTIQLVVSGTLPQNPGKVITGNFAVRALQTAQTTPAVVEYPIQGIDANGPNGTVRFLVNPQPVLQVATGPASPVGTVWPASTRFTVGGCRIGCLRGINGTYGVAIPGIQQVTVSGSTYYAIPTCKYFRCSPGAVQCGENLGFVRQLAYYYPQISSGGGQGIVKKSVGRGFGATRGRGPVRRGSC